MSAPEIAILLARITADLGELSKRLGVVTEPMPSPDLPLSSKDVGHYCNWTDAHARKKMHQTGAAFRSAGDLFIRARDFWKLDRRAGA